jgi:hypothetical protein
MMEAPRRATVRGPTFIRSLACLTAADLPQPTRSLSDQLSLWIDWTHAVALSTALDRQPAAGVLDERTLSSLDEHECARVRSALADAIAGDRAFSARPSGPGRSAAEQAFAEESLDFPFYRQRYLAMQQGIEACVGRLRERLRARLALRSDGLERLAALDTVMERALSRRERTLWSAGPVLLGQHFERLREAARHGAEAPTPEVPASTVPASEVPASEVAASEVAASEVPSCEVPTSEVPRFEEPASDAWLEVFRNDMRKVLLAELDVRLQPAQGLLAALSAVPHG